MIDRQQELEQMRHIQREFLIKCAFLKKTPEEIDKLIYEMEKIRRRVIMR